MTDQRKKLQGVKLTPKLEQLLKQAQRAAESGLSSSASTLRSFQPTTHVPLSVIQAMKEFVGSKQLEAALHTTQLSFSQVKQDRVDPKEQLAYAKRLAYLRRKREEQLYSKLTSNISIQKQDDDISNKSMTYATSIGLNMIVGPVCFGVFMYFFGGSLLNYAWPMELLHPGQVDVRKVILGVLSGVMMLFVEMILFVIRTHELDKALRVKERQQRKTANPFSRYTSNSAKIYRD